jgi:hypothetical protein
VIGAMTASQLSDRIFYLIRGQTDRSETSAIDRIVQNDGVWIRSADDENQDEDDVRQDVSKNLIQWIDLLGQESAAAQNLKQPITCWEKIRPDGPKSYSPVKIVDWIYLMIERKSENDTFSYEPIAFLRFGCRSLFLEQQGQLVKRESTFCALDFYSRVQRQGIGLFLFSEALQHHGIEAHNVAFDRPTAAMISFVQKHFSLGHPLPQHNRFVIFDHFFDKSHTSPARSCNDCRA